MNDVYKNKVYQNEGNISVLNLISKNPTDILDIGCGAGDIARKIKTINNNIIGVTLSEEEKLIAEKFCNKVILADIETYDLDLINSYFDVIVMSHVCEHLVNPKQVLNKLLKKMKDDGELIIAVPNMSFYKNRIKILRGDWSMNEYGPFDKTHLHFYDYNSIVAIFDSNNYKLKQKIASDFAFPLWPFRSVFGNFCRKIDLFFGNIFPNLFGQQIIIILKKNI
jgi:2-polyprenyl-3-methyl-5-hydroxy-6-metoxy-1,4-benzoquinol methylase